MSPPLLPLLVALAIGFATTAAPPPPPPKQPVAAKLASVAAPPKQPVIAKPVAVQPNRPVVAKSAAVALHPGAFNAATVKPLRSYCAAPAAGWRGGHILSFQLNNSTLLRMLLELYFDAPLIPQSFFHACTAASPFLLQHHEHEYHGTEAAYAKVDVFAGAATQCAQQAGAAALRRVPFDNNACLCQYASAYADHAIDYIVSRDTTQLRFVEFERVNRTGSGITSYIASLNSSRPFDAQRFGAVFDYVKQRQQQAPRTPVLDDAAQSIAAACFARRWPTRDLDSMAVYFRELPALRELTRLPLFVDAQRALPSKLAPNVHVMIPTKNPTDLARCLASLYNRADLQFGTVQFHFGIDWKDNKTRTALEKICDTLAVVCTYHEVYARGGDVSAIVNHMFSTIEEDAYFLRFNDDSEMLTPAWNRRAIEALRREPVDAGIAWLTDLSNANLQTHSFVSAVHRRVYGYYFPYHYKNIYEDDWITATYTGELRKPSFIRLKHHAKGSRYSMVKVPHDVLDLSVNRARARMARHLAQHRGDFYQSDSFQ
jgi:hypothetical protein